VKWRPWETEVFVQQDTKIGYWAIDRLELLNGIILIHNPLTADGFLEVKLKTYVISS
jgi:hypothetical protein